MGMAGDPYPLLNGPTLPIRSHRSEAELGGGVVPNTEELMENRSHGRYFAEYVHVPPETVLQEQLQRVLDTAERKERHLVGVAGGLADGGMILFWDT